MLPSKDKCLRELWHVMIKFGRHYWQCVLHSTSPVHLIGQIMHNYYSKAPYYANVLRYLHMGISHEGNNGWHTCHMICMPDTSYIHYIQGQEYNYNILLTGVALSRFSFLHLAAKKLLHSPLTHTHSCILWIVHTVHLKVQKGCINHTSMNWT